MDLHPRSVLQDHDLVLIQQNELALLPTMTGPKPELCCCRALPGRGCCTSVQFAPTARPFGQHSFPAVHLLWDSCHRQCCPCCCGGRVWLGKPHTKFDSPRYVLGCSIVAHTPANLNRTAVRHLQVLRLLMCFCGAVRPLICMTTSCE